MRSKVRLPARHFPIFYCQLAVATFLAIKRPFGFVATKDCGIFLFFNLCFAFSFLFCELAKHQNNWCSDWATLQELVEEIFGRGPVIHARVPTERALEWEKWPYGRPIVGGWQLWRCFSLRAPNDGFLLNTLKTLFRLPRVLL